MSAAAMEFWVFTGFAAWVITGVWKKGKKYL